MNHEDLVSVYTAANSTEAHLVKNVLVDEDIPAFVSEENEPLAGLPIAASDVLVPESHAAQARAIIDSYEQEQIRKAHRPDWKCTACGATVLGAFDICDVCGADRPGDSSTDA